jgi:HPt (histidine-containing phosphotransfer) domain-containing protein
MSTPAQTATQKAIAAIWQRNQPQVLERLTLLDRAAAAALAQTLSFELRDEATSAAHRLAGSLGMFGFPEGTRLARQLEQELLAPACEPATLAQLAADLRASLFPPS